MSEKKSSNIQFMGEANNLPSHVKQNILQGVAFASRWYQNRPNLTAEQRAAITDILHNLKIYCSADPMREVSLDIASGTIRADKETTKWCKEHPGSFMEGQEQMIESAGGMVTPQIEEPVVMICSDAVLKAQNIAIQSSDDKSVHPLLDLADIVSHEVAHLVDYRIGASDQIDQLMTFETNYTTNPYWDANNEIYARIANFRQNFGIDPTHTYTEEEVFDLRMQYLDEVIKL